MKKTCIIKMLLCSLIFLSCNKDSSAVMVRGVIKGYEGKTVYAKKINPFGYESNSLLDSSKVGNNGEFEFEINEPLPLLLNFSKYNNPHPVHKVLQDAPENYYFGYCALFYISEPTLYLTKSSIIDLEWTAEGNLDSFNFKNVNYDYHHKFYDYYLRENLSKGLYEEWGAFKKMEMQEAWEVIEEAINEVLKKYNIDEREQKDKINTYLLTEIKLGAMNMFINWLEEVHKNKLELAFASGEFPNLYSNIFSIYSNNKWNVQSVEFFKMTERFITYQMNKAHRKFQKYYPPNEEKIAITKKILPLELAERYIANFK